MPYERDEVVASVTGFYTFLTSYLHFSPSELKTPPSNGWPEINSDRLAFLSKSDTVIDLLRHLPYLPGYGKTDKWMYDHTVCADYMDKDLIERHATSIFELDEDRATSCPWEKLNERNKDIVILGIPEISDNGCYIFLDTLDGEVVLWDIWQNDYSSFDSADEFFTWVRKRFEDLEVFPVAGEVQELTDNFDKAFKDTVRSFGWPPGPESVWNRDEGLKEIERLWPDY